MNNALAVILAGGRGTRMDILCQARPKPILPFAGRFRVIDFALSNCIHSRIGNIAVLTDYQRSYMRNYLRQWGQACADGHSIDILEPKGDSYCGTADAVYQNLERLHRYSADTILILAADHVYKMDYRRILAYHQRVEADLTIAVVSVPIEQAERFGVVTTNADGKIIDFQEKPRIPRSDLASMGIYVFSMRALSQRLIEDAGELCSPHDFGHAIIPRMVNRDRVFAYKFDGYWRDIGTMAAYFQTSIELLQDMPPFSIDGSWPILTGDNALSTPRISAGARIRHSLVSPGCVIRGQVEDSILSPGVKVEEHAVVRNSVVLANTIVGRYSIVDHCIVDEGVTIGNFSYIGLGKSSLASDGEITVVGNSAVLPPHTAVGRACRILPNSRPDDFIANSVLPGTVIHSSSRKELIAQEMAL